MEGQAHYDDVERGRDLGDILRDELGRETRPLAMTEYGLKGRALTGVVSYADLAAGYAGFQFWRDLSTVDRPGSFVAYDATTLRFVRARRFRFATYVTDAWDEAINRSVFQSRIGKGSGEGASRRGLCTDRLPPAGTAARRVAYVNPQCLFEAFMSP